MTNPSDDTRRLLTGYIGECFHVPEYFPSSTSEIRCMKCGKWDCETSMNNRTFLTWADLGAVKEALERAGKWEAFDWWAFHHLRDELCHYPEDSQFTAWLFRPTVDGKAHFCQLAADFLKEGL